MLNYDDCVKAAMDKLWGGNRKSMKRALGAVEEAGCANSLFLSHTLTLRLAA